MTWSDVAETSKRTGLTKKQVNGVLTSLSGKGLVVTDCDPVNGEGPVQQVLSDWGISAAFELLADGKEAKAAAKPPTKIKVAPEAKASVISGALRGPASLIRTPCSSMPSDRTAASCAASIQLICGQLPRASVKFWPFQNFRNRHVFDRAPTSR